jgi:hypothetical protein
MFGAFVSRIKRNTLIIYLFLYVIFFYYSLMSTICMKIDPGMHIGLHLVFFGKTGVTLFQGLEDIVPGPREVTEALWNACCAAAVATGLTGTVHRSDRCHRSDRHRPSVSPVQHRQQAVQVSAVRVGVFWLGRLFVGS